ncbi:MAG: helix-turn-helix transcriptional regulator [Spirochaetales bacterium]|nr:helix-turn-helix transcriptional regulator [Spirochaetales bacterium]
MKGLIQYIVIIILILLPALGIITLFVFVVPLNPLVVLPSEHFFIQGFWAYASGETVINNFENTRTRLSIEYTLGGDYPFAGIGINLVQSFPFLDLSGYDAIRITLSTENARRLSVALRTFEPGITIIENGMEPLRHSETAIDIGPGTHTYDIPFGSFRDPEWWLNLYVPGKKLEKNNFTYASKIQIFFTEEALIGVTDIVTIDRISFLPSMLPVVLIAVSALAWYMTAVYFFRRRLRRRRWHGKKPDLISSYNKIELISYRTQDSEKINNFLKENYNDPDISLAVLNRETGISKKRISEILKDEYKLAFKELINLLRMEEAKRLLKLSDLNINEIAFRLGYNSNSYFGHIFKMSVGLSPKEYREQKQKS